MTRRQKRALRQRQTTRQLMGITRLTPHGAVTPRGELVFFLIQPDNLSILSSEGVRGRVAALANFLQLNRETRLLALDSRESFQPNKLYYQARLEREESPALRELLRQDMAHLDAIQSTAATAREFAAAFLMDAPQESDLRQAEKQLSELGFRARLAEEQDVMRLLAVYYQQDMTTERFDGIDGERWVKGDG